MTMKRFILLLIMFINIQPSYAGIKLGGTRVIIPSSVNAAQMNIYNTSDYRPYLIQSWVEDKNNKKTQSFIITPPLFKLTGKKTNAIKIIARDKFPENKESLFWLNVKSIPSSKKGVNDLLLVINTKIKLIYRPTSLSMSIKDAVEHISITKKNNTLHINNQSPYYFSFYRINVGSYKLEKSTMIAPFDKKTIALPKGVSGEISWSYINDFGGVSIGKKVD
ncbi:fimbrial biogenesis chaperone [Vibrio algicola]|uniref:Fimbria/pilus periplasmic chaperone n=1 Tax=Vibrio algicola TaxID=2662262 RepID=A0A5Q0TG54_9VIBR|nr:molecular chaperone [Vibrio algicola]